MGKGWALKDLTGRQFGRLTVLHRAGTKNTEVTWLCRCLCGIEKPVSGVNLRFNRTQSCGCLQAEIVTELGHLRGVGNRARNQALGVYKSNAKKRKLAWELDEDTFDALTSSNCHYCGSSLSNRKESGNSVFIYNGIDRVDSKLGYTKENCVPCCKLCNRAKSTLPYAEFLQWVARVAAHLRLL